MYSHLPQVYDFSKVAFGICGLLPDMVRAVPVWIDDHELQRYLFVNVMQKDSKGRSTMQDITQLIWRQKSGQGATVVKNIFGL